MRRGPINVGMIEMANSSEFSKFVERQRALKREAETAFDAKKELGFWLASLASLYERIETYVKEFTASGDVVTTYSDITINEEFCGDYSAKKMSLTIGTQRFLFTPIGTMLIGSRGRVDVLGPAGRAMLGLVDKNAKGVSVQVAVHVAGSKPPPPKQKKEEKIVWDWKIISGPPNVQFTSLTKESFQEMLLSISNG